MSQTTTADRIRAACTDLAIAWPEMIRDIPAARRLGTIGRSSERVEPVRAEILDARADIPPVLTEWAVLVAEHTGHWPQITTGDTVALANYLYANADTLAAHPAGQDAVRELRAAAGTCMALAGSTAAERGCVGVCPNCGTRLHDSPHATLVACPCGRASDVRHVRAAGMHAAADALHTAATAAAFAATLGLRVRRKSVTDWHRAGRLAPAAATPSGPLYRWADIVALAGANPA